MLKFSRSYVLHFESSHFISLLNHAYFYSVFVSSYLIWLWIFLSFSTSLSALHFMWLSLTHVLFTLPTHPLCEHTSLISITPRAKHYPFMGGVWKFANDIEMGQDREGKTIYEWDTKSAGRIIDGWSELTTKKENGVPCMRKCKAIPFGRKNDKQIV